MRSDPSQLTNQTRRSAVSIEVGQRWRSRDPRETRTVEVVEVNASVVTGANGYVTVRSVRKSRLRASTLRSRYDLISIPAHPVSTGGEHLGG